MDRPHECGIIAFLPICKEELGPQVYRPKYRFSLLALTGRAGQEHRASCHRHTQ
jgi:hypothetical protein